MDNLISLIIISSLSLVFGVSVMWVSRKFKVEGNPIVDQINSILPQTQCGQCGYPGCKPYATAIASGEAPINQCPPGGEEGIKKLAALLDVEVMELNPENGQEEEVDMVVEIVEKDCIGCTKCIQACPVDAIIGAAKQMHTVITDACTGCDLCIPVCPVDCIITVPMPIPASISRMQKPAIFSTIAESQQW